LTEIGSFPFGNVLAVLIKTGSVCFGKVLVVLGKAGSFPFGKVPRSFKKDHDKIVMVALKTTIFFS